MPGLFIGLMSGTSFDGIDAALVRFDPHIELIATYLHPIPHDIKQQLLTLSEHRLHDLDQVCRLDVELGLLFADAVRGLLKKSGYQAETIAAIGSHGQTLRHFPHQPYPYTLQIGDPHVIAANTEITVVADFRRHDIALGGQGAPLAPLFHAAFMRSMQENRAIVNIGGFANVTVLSKDNDKILGFDTGPGNVLMDAWAMQHMHQPYDKNGSFARAGVIDAALLAVLLSDRFFTQKPPKSTGRNDFNSAWLNQHLKNFSGIAPQDVQATLTELTARSIIVAIDQYAANTDAIYICGGGVANDFLMERLSELAAVKVGSTIALGLDPHHLEAMLMAWLAEQRMLNCALNLCDITGSCKPHKVGVVYEYLN